MLPHSHSEGRWRFSPFGVPQRRAFCQSEFGTTSSRFFLLFCQPVPQRGHQIIVGELVILLAGFDVRHRIVVGSCGVSGRDQPDLAVQDPDEIVKVLRTAGVPRCFEKLVVRTHVALDVAARFGQQGFQDSTGGFLVKAVFGWGGGSAERLFQKVDANAFGAANFFERGWSPGLALHHLGEQCQAHADDLPFLGETSDRSFEELLLFLARVAGVFR